MGVDETLKLLSNDIVKLNCPDMNKFKELSPEVSSDKAVDEEVDTGVQYTSKMGNVGETDHPSEKKLYAFKSEEETDYLPRNLFF